jgi:hypothetical protein
VTGSRALAQPLLYKGHEGAATKQQKQRGTTMKTLLFALSIVFTSISVNAQEFDPEDPDKPFDNITSTQIAEAIQTLEASGICAQAEAACTEIKEVFKISQEEQHECIIDCTGVQPVDDNGNEDAYLQQQIGTPDESTEEIQACGITVEEDGVIFECPCDN